MIHNRRRVARGGFTLIEVAVATAIVGVGVAALMVSLASGTKVNGQGQRLTQGTVLAQEIREWSFTVAYDSLPSLANGGAPYSPPRDGQGGLISNLTGWSQKVTVTWRDPTDLQTGSFTKTDVAYVQVDVSFKDRLQVCNSLVLSTGWLVTRK